MSFSLTKLAKKAQGLEKRVERDKKQTAELMNDLMDSGSVVAGMFLGGTIDASMENPAIGSVDKSAIAGGVTAIVSPSCWARNTGKREFFSAWAWLLVRFARPELALAPLSAKRWRQSKRLSAGFSVFFFRFWS